MNPIHTYSARQNVSPLFRAFLHNFFDIDFVKSAVLRNGSQALDNVQLATFVECTRSHEADVSYGRRVIEYESFAERN